MESVFLRQLHLQIASTASPVVVVNDSGQILSFNVAAHRCGLVEAGVDLWNLIGEGHERLLGSSLAQCIFEVKASGCTRLSPEATKSDASLDKIGNSPVDLRDSNDSLRSATLACNASAAKEQGGDDVNLENVLFA